ncbi:MAG: DUF4394 domain-containing protein [Cytophagaceae bacterium]|nr:DUF4394 domain-containing protein [Cytophagaceae bacterium]
METIYKRGVRFTASVLTVASLLLLNACQDHPLAPTPRPDLTFYALTAGNQLLRLNVQTSETASATMSITGLQPNENLLAIDFRPATGQLYGVGSSSRLYIINPMTGAARPLGAGSFSPPLNGPIAGFDFNPTVDRIRLVTSPGQNYRLNPETGATMTTDGSINGGVGGTPAIAAVAYTNNRAGAATTVLYDIDPVTDRLYIQNPPNNGTLVDVGPLGMNITQVGGFDISPNNMFALASVEFGGKWELDQVNLTTGKLTKLGDLPSGNIIGLAVPTDPVAYAVDDLNNLVIFNPMSSTLTTVSRAIAGLQSGETVVGLDMRPVNGQLYAIGSTSRIYTINASSGAATMVGPGAFSPGLSGTDFGVDFNPTVDRIRVVSNTGQNIRLHPETGAVAGTDTPLSPSSPTVTAAAYTNNFPPTPPAPATTVLYDIDSNTDRLVKQDPLPNGGILVDVGPLKMNIEASNGFDITGTTGIAYGIFRVGGASSLYMVNLTSGAATKIADFPVATRGFTVGLGF